MTIVCEGKTKIVESIGNGQVRLIAKDDITAGDGKKHDVMSGKAAWATETTVRVFDLLMQCGFPVAFIEQDSPTSFVAPHCRMLPWEVVVRGEAHGSYVKRNPDTPKGFRFEPETLVELYLKTNGKKWLNFHLLCDDPLVRFRGTGQIELFQPDIPRRVGEHFLLLNPREVYAESSDAQCLDSMKAIAQATFILLRAAWQLLGLNLVDFKIEFGIDPKGRLLIADVIDNDSWRLLNGDEYLDKQVYRDGGTLERVSENYQRIAEMTREFPKMILPGYQKP